MNAYRRAGKVRDMFAPVPDTDPCPDDLTVQRDRVLAALTCLRLEEIADDTPAGAYHAGCVVAEHVGIRGDYHVAAFARRYGRALLTARDVLLATVPDLADPAGWSQAREAHVASAVTLTAPTARVITIDPTRGGHRG